MNFKNLILIIINHFVHLPFSNRMKILMPKNITNLHDESKNGVSFKNNNKKQQYMVLISGFRFNPPSV